MKRVIRSALPLGRLGGSADPTKTRLLAAAERIGRPVAEGAAQADHLEELAVAMRAVEEAVSYTHLRAHETSAHL
eukprot:5733591-Alexandrium_andersonii.AAC.1